MCADLEEQMGKIITFVSGKGGTGKTTATGAIGSCMAAMGKKTLCLDCDIGLRNLDIVLGLSGHAMADFGLLFDGTGIDGACIEHPQIENLYFLSAPAAYSDAFDDESAAEIFESLKESFDYVLIDAPAGIGSGFRFAVKYADTVVIVTTGDTTGMRDGEITTTELNKLGITDIKLLVNKVNPGMFKGSGLTVDNVIDTVGAQLIGIVKSDEAVQLSANKETPLVLFSKGKAAKGFLRIARRLCGENIPLSI